MMEEEEEEEEGRDLAGEATEEAGLIAVVKKVSVKAKEKKVRKKRR